MSASDLGVAHVDFASTQWSLVLTAARRSSPDAAEALQSLCSAYWYPLYFYVRRRGYVATAAQDLTQEFFVRLLEKDYLKQANRERGRFRSFLLASMKHFLTNEWHRAHAKKNAAAV
jgi:RNA polymerase sigma-70 factor (ECF subfamily)